MSHVFGCPCGSEAKYACLRRLENAWYDNRRAWDSQSTSRHLPGFTLKPELQWPCEDKIFRQRESPPELVVDRSSQNPRSGNATVDVARYKGVVLARKRMQWKYPADLEYFKEESQTLRQLKHCHIIQFFGSYTQVRDYTILLYPYCEYNLSRFMEENCQARSMEEVFEYPELLRDRLYLESFFPCLAHALMYIHTNTTRHADIKPDNILIKQSLAKVEDCRRYHVYIADFGSASTYSSASRTKRFARSTPKYCAPELGPDSETEDQIESTAWGRAADVFSLGCVFAEMLTVLACEEVVAFDIFRSEKRGADGVALPRQPPRETVDESFCKSLPRVHEWFEKLAKFASAGPVAGKDLRNYWYRRGKLQAFGPWKDTFLDTLDIAASMLSEKQDDRPKIAEVVKRLDVDDCCNREIIPLYAAG
ncbi:serine/threonine protein kinase [Exophiala aquamarina CBS 119918]|uniref:Serine/threonine protein kinase n=1 Tax=Exophiala aquamarina CBS 119918 TaxID=1182545 RepID=A0A072P667_9EURO|nr:serine/threonine protein kinase [Exophiala aquamarina CBS 119918]KEF55614.1 serine/threonine protein kinase [Exophiala aquamarina CBS 119918]